MWHAAAYFDESDDNDRAYAVAGFLAHQHDCVHLDLAWRDRILEKYELEYFKASELNAGTRQFAKFRDNPSNLDCLFSRREKRAVRQDKDGIHRHISRIRARCRNRCCAGSSRLLSAPRRIQATG